MNTPAIAVVLAICLSSTVHAQSCCSPVELTDRETRGLMGGLDAICAPEPAPTSLSVEEVGAILDDLIETAYPELAGIDYRLYFFRHDTIRFRSNITVRSLLWGKRKYRIGVNRSVLADPPPPAALRAVLAHELAHTLYYHQRTRGQIIKTARIFWNRRAQIDFERATDLVAIARGFAPGLAEYRAWIRDRMPTSATAKYYETYYDVDDLALLDAVRERRPELLLDWLSNPPRTREEIEERFSAAN